MSPIDLGLVADGLLIALLAAVIGLAVQLNRKLAAWRQESGAMEQQVATLTAALLRAETAIAQMKGIAREDVAALEAAQKKAQSLRDDLAYLNDRGGALADRLEQAVRTGLAAAPAPGPLDKPAPERPAPAPRGPAPSERPAPGTGDRPMSNAERELLKALEAMR